LLWQAAKTDLTPQPSARQSLPPNNLNANEQSAAELLRFQCLTLWPWTLCYVLFHLRQLIRDCIL